MGLVIIVGIIAVYVGYRVGRSVGGYQLYRDIKRKMLGK